MRGDDIYHAKSKKVSSLLPYFPTGWAQGEWCFSFQPFWLKIFDFPLNFILHKFESEHFHCKVRTVGKWNILNIEFTCKKKKIYRILNFIEINSKILNWNTWKLKLSIPWMNFSLISESPALVLINHSLLCVRAHGTDVNWRMILHNK